MTGEEGLPELPCADFVEVVTDYLEGRLSMEDRQRFDSHGAACPYCDEYLRQLRTTIATLGRLELASLDPILVRKLSSVIERSRA
jgi:anti-sigma factor RsiW